ncbi:MAG: hypothetical protein IT457_24845 [Planctomycetes bacterium]|nr:hypothetical protein [Planctomycetota bacterium]
MPIAALRALAAFTLLVALGPAQVGVYFDQPGMRLRSGTATPNGARWSLALVMENDNANASLPSSFRRWWACGVRGLPPGGTTLDVAVANSGYTDIILPVWSQSSDGVHFGPWTRMPLSAVPTRSGTTHRFSVATPPGVVDVRIAKYFPYSIAEKDALLAGIAAAGGLGSVQTLGHSVQGRPIQLATLTDARVSLTRKRRVWLHAGIHPAETTSYFVVEGFVQELLSGSPEAQILLASLVFDIVPMANPDGVALGNYRTNANSSNLEEEWSSPYASPQPEVVALRAAIEARMGTVAAPGAAPIDLLFNLHSSHGLSWPFHFQHVANASFHPVTNNSGVIPEVHAREAAWIAAFRAASPLVAAGATQSSSLSPPARPFVESMMHDRWSYFPAWRTAEAPVMAITFEGTYGPGPGSAWNSPADWRQCGREMVHAIADMLDLNPSGVAIDDLQPCGIAALGAGFQPLGARLDLALQASPGDLAAVFVFGLTPQAIPLPALGCLLRTEPLIVEARPLDLGGRAALSIQPPPGFTALRTQAAVLRASGASFATSNLLTVLVLR